jgi:hypothetical protein
MSIRRGGLDVDGGPAAHLQAWSKHRLVTVAPSGLGIRHSIVKGKIASRDAVQMITLIHFHNCGAFEKSKIARAKAPRSCDIASATGGATGGQHFEYLGAKRKAVSVMVG